MWACRRDSSSEKEPEHAKRLYRRRMAIDCPRSVLASREGSRAWMTGASRPEWHLLGLAVWSAMARSAQVLWTIYHLLQSLCALALRGCLGSYPDCHLASRRCRDSDDRQHDSPRSPARDMHPECLRRRPRTLPRRADDQNPCRGRREWRTAPGLNHRRSAA